MLRFVVLAAMLPIFVHPNLTAAQGNTSDLSSAEVPVEGDTLAKLLEACILEAGINIIIQNIKAAERESGDINKAIRATLGISVMDIEEHGLLGGPNSEMRKLFEALGLA